MKPGGWEVDTPNGTARFTAPDWITARRYAEIAFGKISASTLRLWMP